MKKGAFPTPQDAEQAFYEALENRDLDTMMEVWAEDEEIVCVHPGGARLTGFEQVRAGWSEIFKSGQRLKVRLDNQVYLQGVMTAVHSVHEIIEVQGERQAPVPVVATNVYVRSAGGWRMIAHHASPAPGAPPPASEGPKILH